jgi:hypothetical protein
MSKLIWTPDDGPVARPRQHQAQMSKPIVFWYSKQLQHIMVPPSHVVPEPIGYERIECRHAHEVDLWSNRLRQQEQRVHQMTLEERYNFEEPIRQHMMDELRKNLRDAKDPTNRAFLVRAIEKISEKREKMRKDVIESKMACESNEGVAS